MKKKMLSIKKFKVSKLSGMEYIRGGYDPDDGTNTRTDDNSPPPPPPPPPCPFGVLSSFFPIIK